MDYKNYRVGYYPGAKKIGVIKFDTDMSKLNYSKAEDELKHIVEVFSIDGYQYEHYQNYLDENGLFMGIFPPEFIEADIKDYYDNIEREEQRIQTLISKKIKEPLDEDYIKDFKTIGTSLEEVINLINNRNASNLRRGGYEFPIEEYYKDILIKYWGDYKL